jgi:hypothetical protein
MSRRQRFVPYETFYSTEASRLLETNIVYVRSFAVIFEYLQRNEVLKKKMEEIDVTSVL